MIVYNLCNIHLGTDLYQLRYGVAVFSTQWWLRGLLYRDPTIHLLILDNYSRLIHSEWEVHPRAVNYFLKKEIMF